MVLNCSFGASQRAAKRTRVRQTFVWARGGDVDTGCMVCPKGAIASEKQKGGFNVCVRACMQKRQLTQIRHTGFQ